MAGSLQRARAVPIRVGVNAGSLDRDLLAEYGGPVPEALVASALKEISYLHSEAMPAGELKHGTLALITDGVPVVVILTQRSVYDKTISAVQEVKARGGKVIAVAYDTDTEIDKHADLVLRIPDMEDLLAPVAAVVPLQLLAYHVARMRGHDIDQPRNLAKSVTVE